MILHNTQFKFKTENLKPQGIHLEQVLRILLQTLARQESCRIIYVFGYNNKFWAKSQKCKPVNHNCKGYNIKDLLT